MVKFKCLVCGDVLLTVKDARSHLDGELGNLLHIDHPGFDVLQEER